MAVYNNRYYPDSRNSTWTSLGTMTWADATGDWASFDPVSANATASWSYTTTATDIGSVKSFYPTTQVQWDRSQPVTIEYEYSTNGSSYTTVGAVPMTARYMRTKITTTGAYLASIDTQINTDTTAESFVGIDSSTLSGNINYRSLPTSNFSTITSLAVTPATTETRPVTGKIQTNDNAGNVTIKVVDLDTWGKTSVDATVNIVVVGFPRITANASLGTVSVTTA